MKIVIINGQNHKGSTRMIARELAEKVGGEITEFFLPRDFDEPCIGCWTCFNTELKNCPHYSKLEPLANALLESDLIILASPVYVYHATGQMMSFLDHFGTWWLVHRPREAMFSKQAVCISTAAGGGMKSTNKDMADSLRFWGVPKIYKLGFGVRAASPSNIPDSIMQKIHQSTDKLALKIKKNANPTKPSMNSKMWFALVNLMHKKSDEGSKAVNVDYNYWEERGWHGKKRPWDR